MFRGESIGEDGKETYISEMIAVNDSEMGLLGGQMNV